jgi:two-component system, NarL family, nitrate/nitrite response regulator NarL
MSIRAIADEYPAQYVHSADLNVAVLARHEVLCRGLEALLREVPSVRHVQVCGHWPRESAVTSPDTDVVILVGSGMGSGLDVAVEPQTKVVMVFEDSQTALAAMSACPWQPDGFLSERDLTVETLHDVLDRVMTGEVPMPPDLARDLLDHAAHEAQPHPAGSVRLTCKEGQTLALLAKGLSNKQIARQLSISSHGVKRLVASLLLKLGSPNRTAAVVNAIRTGIIDAP